MVCVVFFPSHKTSEFFIDAIDEMCAFAEACSNGSVSLRTFSA